MKKLSTLFYLVVFILIHISIQSCVMERSSEEKGNHTEELSFESFDGIKVSRLFIVEVVIGDKFAVTTSVPERYADQLSVKVDSDSTVVITTEGKIDKKRRDVFKAKITCPSFEKIIAEDLTKINVISGFSASNMEISANSLSEITFKEKLNVENNCIVKAENMSKINVSGTASSLEVIARDMADVNCSNLNVKTATATANSMSGISVHADEKFELEASDMSRIRYLGDGEIVRKVVNSMSSINKK